MKTKTISYKPMGKFKEGYQAVAGDFSFKSLINLIVVAVATIFIPFFGTDFSWDIFRDWSFWITAVIKIGLNTITKLTMANHKYDLVMSEDEDIKATHKTITRCKDIIAQNKLFDRLKKEIDDFNMINTLRAVEDLIDAEMNKAKDDETITDLFDKKTLIINCIAKVYSDELENEDLKDIAQYLSKAKADKYSPASVFSKSDTTKRAKKLEHSRKKQIDSKVGNSIGTAVLSVIAINVIDFFKKSTEGSMYLQAALNTVLLVYSGTTGISIGQDAVNDYKEVMNEKETFLVGFVSKCGFAEQLKTEV